MGDIEVKPHADRIGCNDVIDLARLEQLHLLIAGLRAHRAHHDCGAAFEAAHHFSHRVNLVCAEGDNRAARREPRQFARTDMSEGGKAGAFANLGLGDQFADRLGQGRSAQQQGLLAASRVEQPVSENMAAFPVSGELRLVQRHKCSAAPIARHGLCGATQIACAFRLDPFLAGDQRHFAGRFDRADPLVYLAREQA